MVGIPLLLDMEPVSSFLRDADGNIRGALICWGMALGAFVVFRIPRQALLACLFVATVTVGFAAAVVEATPVRAIVSPAKPPMPVRYRGVPPRTESPAAADSAIDSPL
jgi:hypothetical protein